MTSLTVTANPSLNRLWKVLRYDGDRGADISFLKEVVGGSGIVVSRVLSAYHQNTLSIGILAGEVGNKIEAMLHDEGLPTDMVRTDGENRTTYVYIGPKDGAEIEYKEPGPQIKAPLITKLLSTCERHLANAKSLFICGSVPEGTDPTLYTRIVALANQYGVRSFIDADSDFMLEALKQKPYLAKCNATQASEFISKKVDDHRAAMDVLERFIQLGAASAMISLGVRGAVYTHCSWDYALASKPPKISPVDTSGSGDCLLACFALGFEKHGDAEAALRLGTAAGAVNALKIGAGVDLEPNLVEAMAEEVEISRVRY